MLELRQAAKNRKSTIVLYAENWHVNSGCTKRPACRLHAGLRRPACSLHAGRWRAELYTVIQWRCSHLDGNAGCKQAALPSYAAGIRSCIRPRAACMQAACIHSGNTALLDVSPTGRFAHWTFRPLDVSPPGRFAHSLDVLFRQWTFRPL